MTVENITNNVFHIINPERENTVTSGIEKYYDNITLKPKETERRIGLTLSINTRTMPIEIDIDDIKCYAQLYLYKLNDQTHKKYFVKSDRYSSLFNPFGALQEGTENKVDYKNGRKLWEFHEVKPKCFWLYLVFLQTRNEIYLHQAVRANT